MSSDMQNVLVSTLISQINEANALVTRLNAPDDRTMRLHDLRVTASTADETILKFREYAEKLNQMLLDAEVKIDAYITEEYLTANEDDNFDPDTAKEEYKGLKSGVNQMVKALANFPTVDAEAVKAALPELLTLRGKVAGSGGGGTGTKRPRVERMWVNDKIVEVKVSPKNGESYMSSTFSATAQYLAKLSGTKVEVKDLQAAAFETCGTDDLSELDGKVFEFAHSAGGKNYTVKVQPAVGDKAKPAAVTSSDTDDEDYDDIEPTDEEIMAAAEDDD